MNIYHKHHIIPKHMGGSDDPYNIVLLTIEEHAEVHKKLYEKFGKEEDRIAWKCLSGQISVKEAIINAIVAYRKNTKWIHHPITLDERSVKENVLEKFLLDGYKIGRIPGRHGGAKGEYNEQRSKKRAQSYKAGKYFGENNKNYGKKRSLETKNKISEKAKLRIKEKNSFYGKNHTDSFKETHSKRMKEPHKCPHCEYSSNKSHVTRHIKKVHLELGIKA